MTLLFFFGLPARMGGSLHYIDAALAFSNVETPEATLSNASTAGLTLTNVLDDSLELD